MFSINFYFIKLGFLLDIDFLFYINRYILFNEDFLLFNIQFLIENKFFIKYL